MGATKNKKYYTWKYDFIANEILYQTLDCDKSPKDIE